MANSYELSKIGNLNSSIFESDLVKVPIVSQALFILNEAGDGEGIKLTTNHTIHRAFVQKFWRQQIEPFDKTSSKPFKQDDCRHLCKILFLLEESGLVRVIRNRLRTTPIAEAMQGADKISLLYELLLRTYLKSWNWACEDFYPQNDIIQDSAAALLSSLFHWPRAELSAKELFDHHFLIEGETSDAISCFKVRFIDRFALPFGLLEDPSGDPFDFSEDKVYIKTQLASLPPDESQLH